MLNKSRSCLVGCLEGDDSIRVLRGGVAFILLFGHQLSKQFLKFFNLPLFFYLSDRVVKVSNAPSSQGVWPNYLSSCTLCDFNEIEQKYTPLHMIFSIYTQTKQKIKTLGETPSGLMCSFEMAAHLFMPIISSIALSAGQIPRFVLSLHSRFTF